MREEELDPTHIMQVGMGFFGSRTLLTAVELGLFTELGTGKMSGAQIAERLGLHPRAIPDFPDALVALGLLGRDGDGPDALYGNTAETAVFLDRKGANYIGGILEMSSSRLYGFWNNLTEALIDDARRENAFGLLMSLNMLIEFGDAFDYSGADFKEWCSEAGFDRFEVIPLAGPSSAAVAYKPG